MDGDADDFFFEGEVRVSDGAYSRVSRQAQLVADLRTQPSFTYGMLIFAFSGLLFIAGVLVVAMKTVFRYTGFTDTMDFLGPVLLGLAVMSMAAAGYLLYTARQNVREERRKRQLAGAAFRYQDQHDVEWWTIPEDYASPWCGKTFMAYYNSPYRVYLDSTMPTQLMEDRAPDAPVINRNSPDKMLNVPASWSPSSGYVPPTISYEGSGGWPKSTSKIPIGMPMPSFGTVTTSSGTISATLVPPPTPHPARKMTTASMLSVPDIPRLPGRLRSQSQGRQPSPGAGAISGYPWTRQRGSVDAAARTAKSLSFVMERGHSMHRHHHGHHHHHHSRSGFDRQHVAGRVKHHFNQRPRSALERLSSMPIVPARPKLALTRRTTTVTEILYADQMETTATPV